MPISIVEGYFPGCIGRVAQLHALYYSVTSSFGVAFEAKVTKELADFCLAYVPGRDGLWLAKEAQVEGSIAIDGSRAATTGAHLRWFITSEAVRGHGIGRQLLRTAVRFCDDRGYRSVNLWTFAGLDAARHLYESEGFRLVHQGLGDQWGTQVQEQRFVRGDA